MFTFNKRFSGLKGPHSRKSPCCRELGAETLETRALAAAMTAVAPLQSPAVLEASPSQPAASQVRAGNVGSADFAVNGPNPAASAGAQVANPYLGNNPWLDDLHTLGSSPSSIGNAMIYSPLDQQYFTGLQEYAQYEEAINAIAAQQAAQ